MKDWVKRALRTFGQSAIGYVVVALPTVDWTADKAILKSTLIGLGVSSVAAGLAALLNYFEETKG